MRRHGAGPARRRRPRSAATARAAGADQKQSAGVADRRPAASSTRSLKAPAKPCSATEQHQRQPARPPARRRRGPRARRAQRAADRGGDRRGIAVDRDELRARLLGARGGDAAHRIDHRAELADAFDARADVGEALGHGEAAARPSARRTRRIAATSVRLARLVRASPVVLHRLHRLRRVAIERRRAGRRGSATTASSGSASSSPACTARTSADLVGQPQRRVLRLVEDGADPRAARQLVAHPRIRHAAEAGEHLEFEELRIIEPQRVRPPRAAPAPGSCRRPG